MDSTDVSKRLSELERQFRVLSNDVRSYPVIPDARSKGAIADTVKDQIFTLFWDKIYWYSTGFESIDNLNITAVGTGGASLFGGSLQLVASSGASGNSANVIRNVAATGSFSFEKESRFRTQVYFNSYTTQSNQTIYITLGGSLTESYGFKVLNSTLYGLTAKGSSVTVRPLNITVNDSDLFKLEAHYLPDKKVTFWVDDVPVGEITTTLPKTTNTTFFNFSITTQDSGEKDFGLYFFDYSQLRSL